MADAAEVLKILACRVIETVREVDLEHDVAAVMQSLTVTPQGKGEFRIRIESATKVEGLNEAVRAAIIGGHDE